MVNQDQFIKGEWYICERNAHFYQFDKIENDRFIASAWIHRGSFTNNSLSLAGYKKELNSVHLVLFNPNKKAPIKVVNRFILDKQVIIELW